MATKEQIKFVAEELAKAHPANLFKVINDSNAGTGFVLKLLDSAEGNRLSAGTISDAMNVSTARVAVLLKKMEGKGLIVKESDKTDARVTIVRLSDEGKRNADEMWERMRVHIENVIDKLGIEKLEQFIALSVEVKTAMEEDVYSNPKTFYESKIN